MKTITDSGLTSREKKPNILQVSRLPSPDGLRLERRVGRIGISMKRHR